MALLFTDLYHGYMDELAPRVLDLARFEQMEADVAFDKKRMAALLESKRVLGHCVYHQEKHQILAYSLYYWSDFSSFRCTMELYLEDLYVSPGLAGLGVGKRFLGAIAHTHPEASCLRFEVLDWNTDAIAFYQKLGAVEYDLPRTDKKQRTWLQMMFPYEAMEELRPYGYAPPTLDVELTDT